MIIYRYIIKEHILPFIYTFFIIIFIFIMQLAVELLRKLLYKGLDFSTVFELFMMNIAWMIVLATPMAVLMSTLMTFGKMSADNEIVALKSSGMNLPSLLPPVLSAALCLTIGMVFFHNSILPDANHRNANLMLDISRKRPTTFIEPNILIRDYENYSIMVRKVTYKTGILHGVTIFTDIPGEKPSITIADSGTIRLSTDEKFINLTLYDGQTHTTNKDDKSQHFIVEFSKHIIAIPNIDSKLQRTDRSYRTDREKSAEMLLGDVREFRTDQSRLLEAFNKELDILIQHIESLDSSSKLASSSSLQQPDTPYTWNHLFSQSQPILSAIQQQQQSVERYLQNLTRQERNISENMVEVHKKYSISFACIIFVLIGAPLGIMARRGGITVGVAYSIFFFVLYWIFLIGGENLADKLIVSPLAAMWSCNIIIGMFGIILILRMIRDREFFSITDLIKRLKPKKRDIIHPLSHHPTRGLARIGRSFCNFTVGTLPMYLLRMFFSYMAVTFLGLIIVFDVIDYISNINRFINARFIDIALYYWYYNVWFIGFTLPMGLLLTSMFTMSTLATNNELTAIKSTGINIKRITILLIFIGLLFSVGNFYLNEKLLPIANQKRDELIEDIRSGKRYNPAIHSAREQDYFRNFYYFADPRTAYRIEEFYTNPLRAFNAQRTVFTNKGIAEQIDAEQMVYDSIKKQWAFIHAERKFFKNHLFHSLVKDTLFDSLLTATAEQMTTRIRSIDELSYWELADQIAIAKKRGEKVTSYETDLYFKIALPFMNFIVIILGLAITARSGKKGAMVNFGIGLAIIFAFFFISQFVLALGKNETIPPLYAAWATNIFFLFMGLILYQKASA